MSDAKHPLPVRLFYAKLRESGATTGDARDQLREMFNVQNLPPEVNTFFLAVIDYADQVYQSDDELLAYGGWVRECSSPLELRHEDGSFATGQAADLVMADLREGN